MFITSLLTKSLPPGRLFLSVLSYSGFWFSSIAPRLTGRQAKGKEEKEIKETSLSLHFELHEAT